MKTFALIAILLAGVTCMSASNISSMENSRCRQLAKLNAGISADILVANDLLNGTWTSVDGAKYEFSGNGQLAVFEKNRNGDLNVESSNWEIELIHGTPTLVLTNNGRVENMYSVVQTCDGVKLTDFTAGNYFLLDYSPAAMPGLASRVKIKLPGEWTNVTSFENGKKCPNKNGNYLSYVFSADGNYRCIYGSQKLNENKKGSWTVSKDGQFLLLNTNDGGVDVIRISQVDDHGLVLEQVMMANEVSEFFCSEIKTFAFIK